MRLNHTLGMALLLAALVGLAACQSHRLIDMRRHGLPTAPAYAADTPPVLNLVMVGLGGFRGIAAEILWFRADRLQQEGRYVELVQLSAWIAQLDPRATETWAYSAWNMAYNISAMMNRPEDRLRWVAHGVSLLRDDALAWNPTDARLYRELAWLYLHKVGSDSDTAHIVYKLSLAEALAPLVQADGTLRDDGRADRGLAELRLEPARMRALQARFGPIDWRLPESLALYWAWQGVSHAAGLERLACRRTVYQSLMTSVARGRFTGDLAAGRWQTAPNPALTPATLAFLEETYAAFPTAGVREAFGYFLVSRVRAAHAAGDDTAARAHYARLVRLSGTDSVPPFAALVEPQPDVPGSPGR
jgi:hypothetical protein